MFWRRLISTEAPASVILIRLMVEAIFLSEGIQKFLYPAWEAAHAARTDWAMLLGSLFLLIRGGGKWSADLCLTAHVTDQLDE